MTAEQLSPAELQRRPPPDPNVVAFQSPDAADLDKARAFDSIVAQHYGKMLAFAKSRTGSVEAAEDIAQETFLRAWRNLSTFKGDGSLSNWLFRIAHNHMSDELRKDGRRVDTVDFDSSPIPAPERADMSPEAALEVRQKLETIKSALAKVSPASAEALILFSSGLATYDDIKDIQGISLANVKWRIHHARKAAVLAIQAD